MVALSDLIAFLLELMRDPATAAEFEADPDAALAARGLDGVTAQDVRDARLELADSGGASATGDAPAPSGDDPVREISHTTSNYSASAHYAAPAVQEHTALAAQAAAPVSIDDRDTFFIQNSVSDDDITVIEDSFNSVDNSDNSVDNSVTAVIDDSTTNNIDNSVTDVVAIDADNAFNDNSTTDVVAIDADNAFNDTTAIGELDLDTGGAPVGAPAPVDAGEGPFPVEADGGTGAAPDPEPEPDATAVDPEPEPAELDEPVVDEADDAPAEEPTEAFDPVA